MLKDANSIVIVRWLSVNINENRYTEDKSLWTIFKWRFQCFLDARMWTQCTLRESDIVSAVSGLCLNNLAS